MKVVLDANCIFARDIPVDGVTRAYIPSSVEKEIKDDQTRRYYEESRINIDVRDPQHEYVEIVLGAIKDKHLGLSSQDIDVIALTLEINEEISNTWLDIKNIGSTEALSCLSKDNGVRNALYILGLNNDEKYTHKTFKLRCYACSELYDKEVDFCRKCGYNTITRVSVITDGEQEIVLLKKDYRPRPKTLKDSNGMEILSEDQREYNTYLRQKKHKEKMANLFPI